MKFFRRKLRNGMTVIGELRDLPLVAVSITNRFGAGHEKSAVKGIAHSMEHLVFTGTTTRTHEDISREIESKGGVLNAFTAQEATSFWCKLPSEHLVSGIQILWDILENPVFEAGKFEKEKRVILEEIKMYRDTPQHHVFDLLHTQMYRKPFSEGILGSETTIRGLGRDFVAKYFHEHYAPSNYIVTLVGKADVAKVCALLERLFPARRARIPRAIVRPTSGHIRERRAGIDQAHYAFGIHAPLSGTKEHYALEILDAFLANGMSSRLFLKIREERGLAYSVKSALTSEQSYSNYTISVGTTAAAVKEVQRIILEEFKAAQHITAADVGAAQERLLGLHKIHQEDSAHVMGELIFSELAGGAEDYYRREQHLRAVRVAEVQDVARVSRFSTALIVPR